MVVIHPSPFPGLSMEEGRPGDLRGLLRLWGGMEGDLAGDIQADGGSSKAARAPTMRQGRCDVPWSLLMARTKL